MSKGSGPLRVAIAGGGYVGLVTAAGLTTLGHQVTVVEAREDRVKALEEGRLPIREPALDDLWARGTKDGLKVKAVGDGVYGSADLILICVGTPALEDGAQDLGFVRKAVQEIGGAIQGSGAYPVVAMKSTVLPGTTEGLVKATLEAATHGKAGRDFGLASVPEFLAQGSAVQDFLHPSRIVVGALDQPSIELVLGAHEGLPGRRIVTDPRTAEMIKYTSNAFLASRVSLSNEIGNMCKALGIDANRVLEVVGMDERIGPKYLLPGLGFGGSCLAKDVSALAAQAETLGLNPMMLRATLKVNEDQPRRLVDLLGGRLGGLEGRRIALLGLAFKPGTDDIRESRGLEVGRLLVKAGAQVVAYDPMALSNARAVAPELEYTGGSAEALAGADACVIATEWPEFGRLETEFRAMKRPLVVDGRRALLPQGLPIEYEGLCW